MTKYRYLKNPVLENRKYFRKAIFQLFSAFALSVFATAAKAQSASIFGKFEYKGEPISNVVITLKDVQEQWLTDIDGRFLINNAPTGKVVVQVQSEGFLPITKQLFLTDSEQFELKLNFSTTYGSLSEIVVTGTRTNRRRPESPVAVDVIDSKTFSLTQSNTLSEGLCFSPGLRMETDCQTCSYSQLRMNGLGGSYSQVLVNSRPVFSSLMSLYGLEQIPANMIDRVEVVRGGGSVLYGTSAIAGTVNVLTKEPQKNSYTITDNYNNIAGQASDNFLNANVNLVKEDKKRGISIFASRRDREAYDANGDGFSELPRLTNNSVGVNSFIKSGQNDKLTFNAWYINEERQGGNKVHQKADQADQSEYRLHNIILGGLNYDHYFKNEKSNISIYASGQNTRRLHYTGIDGVDAWGATTNYAYQTGLQYNYTFNKFLGGKNTITTGLERQYEYTYDKIAAYNYLIDQHVALTGLFAQSDWEITKNLTLLTGIRANQSNRVDRIIMTPKVSALYKLPNTQIRASYARGFKAPQAFETDMHIAFAAGGVSIIQVSPDLQSETSNSYNASIDYNKASEETIYGFTLNGFYTQLQNTFILEELGTDANGNQKLLRLNGGGSTVKGITLEGRWNYNQIFQMETGITLQKSTYERPVQWSADVPAEKQYLRTPNTYGYYTLSILPKRRLNGAISGVITGPMLVPHFGGAPGVPDDVVIKSKTYLANNIKAAYSFPVRKRTMEVSLGIKNMFNQYQQDFDTGKNRDSNYIYGPLQPRSFVVGLKVEGGF